MVSLGSNHPARTVYWMSRVNSNSVYLGFYRFTRREMINDCEVTEAELSQIIDVLKAADLIDYDDESGFVRVVGWFYEEYAPENRSQVITRSREYLTNRVPRAKITARSIAEFLCGSAVRVSEYDPESKHGPEVIEELRRFIVQAKHKHPDLNAAMIDEVRRQRLEEVPEVKDICFGLFDYSMVPARCPHDSPTMPPQERKAESEKGKEKGNRVTPNDLAQYPPKAETLDSLVAREARAAGKGL